jgi:fibronectin-binding autotransporter adhesin
MKKLVLASVVLAVFCSPASAANRYWDNDATATGNNASTGAGLGGTGTWDTSALKWWDGVSADVAWNNGNNDDAVFTEQNTATGAAPARTVTISGTVTANSLTFSPKFISPATNPANYTLTGGTAISLTSGQITLPTGNNANTTINTPIIGTTNLTIVDNNTTANTNGITLGAANPGLTGNINLTGGGTPTASSWAIKLNLTNTAAIPGAATFNFARSFSQVNFNTAANFGNVPNNFNLNSGNLAGTFDSWIGALSGASVNLTGLISGNSNLTFGLGLSGGAGVVTLSTANTYTGATTRFFNAQTGVIKLGVDNALPVTTGLSFGTGSTPAGSLDLNGKDQTVTSLASPVTTGVVNGIANTQGATRTSVLTINGSATTTYSAPLGFVLNNANMPGAAADLAKIKLVLDPLNTGTQILTGANTYSGGTTISGGTLKANNTSGSATGTGAIVINNGGTLAGTGAVSGAVTVNTGGKLSPGASVESLALGALSFAAGSTLLYEIDSSASLAAGADLVNVALGGAVAINPSAVLNATDVATTPVVLPLGTKFTLLSYDKNAGLSGNFAGDPQGSTITIGLNQFAIDYADIAPGLNFDAPAAGGSFNYVTLTAVPEAGAVLFGGMICLVIGVAYGGRKLLRRGVA